MRPVKSYPILIGKAESLSSLRFIVLIIKKYPKKFLFSDFLLDNILLTAYILMYSNLWNTHREKK